jgi:Fe-S oxidoreductase
MEFSGWEQGLLAALVVASALVFFRDLSRQLRKVTPGKAERPRTDRLPSRLLRVVREVVFQSRVVGGRPVAGTLHALVFVGFAIFAFETTDHFLEPFHLPFLATLFGSFLPLFRAALLVTALLVSVGILGLFYRRFFMRRVSPDPKSYSSGVVALLIFVLMLTYVNGADVGVFQGIFGSPLPAPLGGRANWWLHALIILVFPHLILRSKHFHILMAPVDIFFRTHRLGELLPLDLDLESLESAEEEVSLGLETIDDLGWKLRMDFLTCVECRRCTDQCPANASGQELDPRAFILAGRAALDSGGPIIGGPNGPGATRAGVISEEALGQCTTCGACENICPVGIEHLQLLIGAKRAQALSTGKGLVAGEFLQTVERYGNPFSAPPSARGRLIAELDLPIFESGKSEYLLWLGCVWSYNEDARSSLEAMVKVLRHAKVSFGVLETESCSGHHSRRQGEELQFQTLAGENIERFKAGRVQKIVAPCPHCLHTFRREYPTLDESVDIEVLHHSELLTHLVAEGRLQLEPLTESRGESSSQAGSTVTFHDPCYLGRFEDTYDAPREVIRQTGHRLVELGRSRERSFCCGGGGAGFMREQQARRRVDQERKDEIAGSGATTLVTACPECKMMLNAAVEETIDLAELVARHLPAGPAAGPHSEPPTEGA